MSLVDDLKGLNQASAVLLGFSFVGLMAPGLLTLVLFNPNLFKELETTKVVLFSIALTAPGVFVPFFVSTIGALVLAQMMPGPAGRFGSRVDWFAIHTAGNGFNSYLALFLSYLFSWSFKTFALVLFGLIVIFSYLEMKRLVKIAAGKIPPANESSSLWQ